VRLENWEALLSEYLASMQDAEFVWGQNDCAMFACNGARAITGVDPIPHYRGKYSTAMGSAKALKRYGAGTLEASLDLLFPVVAASHAGRGDLVFYNKAVGICYGATGLFIGEENELPGIVSIPRSFFVKGWSVG
jgi:hypothetical protein